MRPGGKVERADDLEYFFWFHTMDFRLILLPFVAGNSIRHIAGDQSELLERRRYGFCLRSW